MGDVLLYFTRFLNSFAPLQKVSSRKSKRPTPWLNECIAAKIKVKNCAKQIATRSGIEEDKEVYRRIKNELNAVIREAQTTTLGLLCLGLGLIQNS